MKTNGARILIIAIILYFCLLIFSFSSFAVPDYDFSSGRLIRGTDRTVGAQYRFTNVKRGVDAIVTITALTGGVTLNSIDGSSGFNEAFQPVIDVAAYSSGYAEFRIDFVLAGTFTPTIMIEVPMTPIDVDGQQFGRDSLFEFDMIALTPANTVDYNMLGRELQVNFTPGWVTGRNTAAIDYGGVDTLAKQVMFTVTTTATTNALIRVGARNNSNGTRNRLRSVYFQRFTYLNSFLSKPALMNFRGVEKNKKVDLQWELSMDHRLNLVEIESSSNGSQFRKIGSTNVNDINQRNFFYTDNNPNEGNAFYRLRMIGVNGTVTYSNILSFRSNREDNASFKIYPSAVESSATLNIKAGKTGSASFRLVDYAGRIVHQETLNVQEGSNTLLLSKVGQVKPGNYIAVLEIDHSTYNQKILKK